MRLFGAGGKVDEPAYRRKISVKHQDNWDKGL